MTPTYEYRSDQELPVMQLNWRDGAGTTRDLSSGFTATVKVATQAAPTTIVLTKTAGITLAATSPNYQIEWTAAELATLVTALGTVATHGDVMVMYPYIRRNADSKDDVFSPNDPPTFRLHPAPV